MARGIARRRPAMIQFDDVREMERRASVCYGDGLLDIGIGFGLLFLGFVMIFGLGALAAVYMAFLFPIVRMAKRSITVPRMHHLDFMPEPDTESRLFRVRAVVVASMAVLLSIGVLAFFMSRMIPARISAGLRANAMVIFGVMLAALFVFMAWGTAIRRLRFYAALTVVALIVGYWFNMSPISYLMVLGAVIVTWGANVLAHFLRTYPKMIGRNGGEFLGTYSQMR
jgi:hypothetical protein